MANSLERSLSINVATSGQQERSSANSVALDPTAAAPPVRNGNSVSIGCAPAQNHSQTFPGLSETTAFSARRSTALDLWTSPPLGASQSKSPSNPMALLSQPNFEFAPRPFSKQAFQFRGPTSAAFGFSLAKNSLQTLGVSANSENVDQVDEPLTLQATNTDKDPLWSINKDEALRLINVYDDECGSMYPFIDMDSMKKHINRLYDFMRTVSDFVHQENLANVNFLNHVDNDLLKAILASALTIEGNGQSALGSRIFEDVQKNMLETSPGGNPESDVKRLKIVMISAIYYFQTDEEHLAWRKVGQAARSCVELGIHRRKQLEKLCKYKPEFQSAVVLFWCVYVLDRRWSFGCGLSFSIRESDIDPTMPEPDPSEAPYLFSMVHYARIASRAWSHISNYNFLSIKKEDIEFLDCQLMQWKEKIPTHLQIRHHNTVNAQNRTTRRLRTILFLRFNQMRILIYRPVLFSPVTIFGNLTYARRVVEVAKQSIQVLKHLDQTSDIYRTQQVCFNHFLYAAITALFLALSHAKDEFSGVCGKEFAIAVDLVRSMSTHSYVSKRLWQSIGCLEHLASDLGVGSQSSTALAEKPWLHEYPSQLHKSPAGTSPTIPPAAKLDPPTSQDMWNPDMQIDDPPASQDMWNSDIQIDGPGPEWDEFLAHPNFWETPEPPELDANGPSQMG